MANAINPGEKSAISHRIREKWDWEADVVVVGSGAAGHAAAIAAADKKASVVILEKMRACGGNSLLSGGNYGSYGTELQKKRGCTDPHFRDDSAELYYREKRTLGGYRSDPALTRTFTDNALAGYNWLTSLGMKFNEIGLYEKTVLQAEGSMGMYFANTYNALFENGKWSGVMTKGRHHRHGTYKTFKGGRALIRCLRDSAQVRGITSLTSMEVLEIIRENSGKAIGVSVQDHNSGKTIAVRAHKAVILAAGGFSANIGMCIKYDQRIHPKIRSTGMKGVTGDLLIAAQDVGADTVNMDFVQCRMDESAFAYHHKVMASKPGTYIDVDSQGKRFWKEMPDITAFRSARLNLVHAGNMYKWFGIADADGIKANKVTEQDLKNNLNQRKAFRADSLEELAKIIGVPANNIVATVDRYNDFVAQGRDDDFGQHREYLQGKIAVPPFFALPKTYYIHCTLGGVRLNEKAQVIDRHGKIIPRLYAAGEFAGGIHGLERNGGCGITGCIVFGRIAGENAASEKQSG